MTTTSAPPKTILVVEDDEAIREMLRVALSLEYRVLTASDGYEALDVLWNVKPDLVITDLAMPKVNGVEFIKVVRSRYTFDEMAVMALTGAPELLQAQAMAAGADVLVRKPVRLSALRAAIAVVLIK